MSVKIKIREDIKLGTWQGMGGAITEATAYNFSKLNPEKKKELLDAYYGKDGLDYRWCRISVGSNDFCLKPYEYTTKADLSDFSIKHDQKYILPMLKRVTQRKKLTFIAAPWSPPSCMKTSKRLRFGGRLSLWHYKSYARYLRTWLEAYAEEGIKVDYLSPQNEPFARQIWESCLYTYSAQRRLAYRYLASELKDSDVKMLLWDHNKAELERVAKHLLKGGEKNDKIAGLCFHWYDGTFDDEMWKVRQKFPNAMLVSSEMCCGFNDFDAKKWENDAKMYLFELFSDINCGVSAWLDWNMLLTTEGGPSYCQNYVKSPVLLNETQDDFILTPIYDALKRFAAVFPAGSKVVRCESDSRKVVSVARKVEDGYELVLANVSDEEKEIEAKLGEKEQKITLKPLEIKKISF